MKRILLLLLILIGCSQENSNSRTTVVVTNKAIEFIIKEIVGPRGNVVCLLSPSDSPHSYQIKPSDAIAVKQSSVFIFVANELDGWASKMESSNKIELIKYLPAENTIYFNNTKIIDPHFWTDPLTVKAMLPALVEILSKVDSKNSALYKTNSELFSKRLELLDVQINAIIKDIKGKYVFSFHPSFNYFIKRYGLNYGGSIEEIAGHEPTANDIARLIKKLNETGTKAVFTEPQLNETSAIPLIEGAKVTTYMLDPIGGAKGRENYSDLMLYNARIMKVALQ